MPRVMNLSTPLGEDVLLFHGMRVREALSRPSELHLDLLSQRGDIDLDEILGKNVTVRLALHDDSTRYFNGYVTRFAQRGTYGRYHRYAAEVRPWLWFLTRTADCRIFQDRTVPDILRQVFADHPMNDFAMELTGAYRKWTYCVQYRETDFDFVSRLMEEEGIYYYIRHSDGHNTLVLADSSSAHTPAAGYEEVPFIAPDHLARPEVEHVSAWEFSREIQPGVYVHDDFDMTRPGVKLRSEKRHPRSHVLSDYEVFEYPGRYQQKGDGEQYAGVRIEELAAQFETAEATTNARGIAVGSLVTLKGCPREDQNREHLVIEATCEMEFGDYEGIPEQVGATFRSRFVAMASQQQFRPRRRTPRPFVQGPQTALVVGPSGEEIYTDAFGRVKVQFHWDRYGQRDENSSCWIRVSHPWAGKGWGAVSTPRIGQEVIVDFLEGDPDRPIITGRVYNGDCQPPFGFPAGAVVSGMMSQTHKGAGYNEISANDTAGQEMITIHGQFDMATTVEHDQTITVHNSRTGTIDVDDTESVGNNQTCSVGVDHSVAIGSNQTTRIGSNQTITIGASRTESVGASETITVTGHRTETVDGGETVTVSGGRTHTVKGVQSTTISLAEAHTVGAARAHTVGAGEAITVGGAQAIQVGALQSVSVGAAQMVQVGGLQSITVGGPHKLSASSISETARGALKIKAGAPATIEAPSIVLKAGSSKIVMNASGITIKGAKVMVSAPGRVSIKGSGGVKVKGATIGEN